MMNREISGASASRPGWGMDDPSKALIRIDKAVKVNVSLVDTIER